MTEILRIKNLSKSFGRKKVIQDFNLTLEKGKVYGLLGKNGEGKTTLIRMVMGILPSDKGEIFYKGTKIKFTDSSYKKEVGYISEDSIFFGWMKIKELLRFNASFYSTWNSKKSFKLLERFSLDKNVRIKNLSRGMKLKLGLIVALCAEPELLILDDPTSGLDVPTRHDFLQDVIREILDSGTTILFSSHQVHEIEGIIDYLCVLHKMTLILDDDYQNVKKNIKRINMKFENPLPEKWGIEGILTEKRSRDECELVIYPWNREKKKQIEGFSPVLLETEPLSLEEMFISFVS